MELGNLAVIVLKKDAYEAVICPEVGGMLVSLTKNGVEAMNTPSGEAALKAHPTSFGFPLLLPPNRIDGGTFTAAGKTYHFPVNEPKRNNSLHGFLHTRAWQVESRTEDSAVLVFHADENTDFYNVFPVKFTARRVFELTADGLKETDSVENTGDVTMPVGLGFHTAFHVEENTRVLVSVGKRILTSDRMLPVGVRELNEDEAAFRSGEMSPVAWAMDDHYTAEPVEVDGEKFHGAILKTGHVKVTYTVSPFYRHWVIWNCDRNGKFFCIEPQNWRINAPNLVESLGEEAGMDLLEPGRSLSAWMTLKIDL